MIGPHTPGAHGVGGDRNFGRRPVHGAVHARNKLLRDHRCERQHPAAPCV